MGLARALCVIASALLAAPALTFPSAAQTVLGITLGEPIPDGLPEPLGTQIRAPFSQTVWADIDGVTVTVIGDVETGEVLFMELRPAAAGPVPAQIDGLTFRETTRADLHGRFGSEGVVFADVGRTGAFGDIAAYFTNYEIEGRDVVVSFVTIQPLQDASQETADASVLDSVVVARDSYLNEVWGMNRGRLPGYAPIADPFTE